MNAKQSVELVAALQALEELAIAFQREVKTPLGFHTAFVAAKYFLRAHGRELPERISEWSLEDA